MRSVLRGERAGARAEGGGWKGQTEPTASLATDGVCTMQAAAAQQMAVVFSPRTDEQLRNSFNFKLYAIKLENACRMYGVAMPTESEGYRAHNAMYDAEVAGRLYFAMRGIAYAAETGHGCHRVSAAD